MTVEATAEQKNIWIYFEMSKSTGDIIGSLCAASEGSPAVGKQTKWTSNYLAQGHLDTGKGLKATLSNKAPFIKYLKAVANGFINSIINNLLMIYRSVRSH